MSSKNQLIIDKIKEIFYINQYYLRENFCEWKTGKQKIDYVRDFQNCFDTCQPCLTLSTGRCGTKLLTKVLSLGKKTCVYHSDFLVPNPLFKFFQNKAFSIKDTDQLANIFEAGRAELIYRAYRTERFYMETNPRITFLAPGIKKLYPQAKFIHLVRHPAKVIISFLRRNMYQNNELEDIGLLKKTGDPQWEALSRIAKVGWMWNETQQFIEDFKNTYPQDVLTIRSEDLFKDYRFSQKIFDFLVLPQPSEKKLIKLLVRPTNPQTTGNFPTYQQWAQKDKDMLKQVAPLYEKYAYEL